MRRNGNVGCYNDSKTSSADVPTTLPLSPPHCLPLAKLHASAPVWSPATLPLRHIAPSRVPSTLHTPPTPSRVPSVLHTLPLRKGPVPAPLPLRGAPAQLHPQAVAWAPAATPPRNVTPPRRSQASNRLTPPTTAPSSKRRGEGGNLPTPKRLSCPAVDYGLPKELGECVSRDVELLRRLGWRISSRRAGRGETWRT